MEELYLTWPEKLIEGYIRGYGNRVEFHPRSIIFCGMGGSGITGDIASLSIRGVPSITIKGFRPPQWVTDRDLVIGVSYSGNTLETITCVMEALERGSRVSVITSGGRLSRIARDRGIIVLPVSTGYYPRTAMAEMVGLALGHLADITMVDEDAVKDVASAMRSIDTDILRDMAINLSQKNFISILACGGLGPVAKRLRSELAENSKILSREEVYPESGHNDIVSWQVRHKINPGFLLLNWTRDRVCSTIMDHIIEVYSANGPVYRLESHQRTLMGAALELSMMGGLLSVYLAGERGIDPRDTSSIARYKDSIRKALSH